jgi:large subunit ribosomal protein L18
MNTLKRKQMLRQKRVWRIRKKVTGTAERPRLCVSFSNKHIYAQAIDDTTGKTLVAISSLSKALKDEKLTSNSHGGGQPRQGLRRKSERGRHSARRV